MPSNFHNNFSNGFYKNFHRPGSVPAALMGGAGVPANAFLPNTTGVYGAYGLSQMVAGYTGNACKIRRASDGAEVDYPLVNGRVDADAISAWIGSSTGYIIALYDQSGNGNTLSNATSANCPVFSTSAPISGECSMVWGQAGISKMAFTVSTTLDGRNFGFGLIGEIYGTNHISHFAYFGDGSGATPRINLFMQSGTLRRFHSATGAGNGAQYPDSNRQLISFSGSASSLKAKCRTGATSMTANAVGSFVNGVLSAGYAGTTNPLYANVSGFVIWNATPADADLTAIDTAIDTRYGALSLSKTWVFVGDSITAGFGAKSGKPVSKRLVDLAADPTIRHCNAGNSGVTTAGIVSLISNYTQFYNGSHTQNLAFLMAGTNDLRTGVATATTISNLTSIVTSLKSAGFYVVQMTVLPGSGVNEPNRVTVNAAITGGTTGADLIVDAGADSRFLSGSYFYDGLHPNDLGYDVIAELLDAAI